jgi:hypothetical protein
MIKQEKIRYNLYFIIRSIITSLSGFAIFSTTVYLLRNVSYVEAIIISFISFSIPTVASSVLHERIERFEKNVLFYLDRHKRTERIIVKILK